jgi:hypothetical protein
MLPHAAIALEWAFNSPVMCGASLAWAQQASVCAVRQTAAAPSLHSQLTCHASLLFDHASCAFDLAAASAYQRIRAGSTGDKKLPREEGEAASLSFADRMKMASSKVSVSHGDRSCLCWLSPMTGGFALLIRFLESIWIRACTAVLARKRAGASAAVSEETTGANAHTYHDYIEVANVVYCNC